MNSPLPDSVLLSYGQLSVWRDIDDLPRARWHEANFGARLQLPADGAFTVAETIAAVRRLGVRHESLRTIYSTTDPRTPQQSVLPPGAEADVDVAVVECASDEINLLLFEQLQLSFDLARAYSWRARVITQLGRPVEVMVVRHHITADGGSDAVLQADLHAALKAGDRLVPNGDEAVPGPVALAEWQRSSARARGRKSTLAHWGQIFGTKPVSLPALAPAGAGEEVLQCMIRSPRAYESARRLATRLGVPLPSVVLAAFTWSVAKVAQAGGVVVDLMSSNRFYPQWSEVVTSMNQYAAASFTLPERAAAEPVPQFVEYVRHVQARSFAAYRHGMYDVDEMAELRGRTWIHGDERYSACAFNFIELKALAVPLAAEPPGGAETVWEQPFHSIGHPCYLRAIDEVGQSLILRLRTKEIAAPAAESILRGMYEALIAAEED